MKIFSTLIKTSLIFTWLLTNGTTIVRSQDRNMSDITGPNTGEIITDPEAPVDGGGEVVTDPEAPVDGGGEVVTDPEAPVDGGGEVVTDPEAPVADGESSDGEVGEESPVADSKSSDGEVGEESPVADGESPDGEVGEESPVADGESSDGETDQDTVAEEEEADKDAVAEEEETDEDTVAEKEKKEAEDEEEESEEKKSEQADYKQEIDRAAYELQIQQASTDVAIQMNEEFQTAQLMDYSGMQIYGQTPSVEAISQRLGQLWQQTGKKAAFINISLQSNQLETFTVLPTVSNAALEDNSLLASNSNKINTPEAKQATIRSTISNTSRKELLVLAKEFRQEISDVSKIKQNSYLTSSQELYQQLIAPIEQELEANDIDILVFSMDTGLRLLPIAALHDGKQFLIEKYALAIVPSFGLTDTRYVNLSKSQILAMGASQFKEQTPLPTMPLELQSIIRNPRQGEVYLNEDFTIANFKAQNSRSQPFPIIHLGTHAEFKAGHLKDSYIQFYDNKLRLSELKDLSDQLGWNSGDSTPVELLVLSACETAIGDENAELGFAGLAVQAGVKSALASLWYVSDLGTLALMSEFYDQLSDTLIKAEALRQTQLEMLKEDVKITQGKLQLSNGEKLNLPANFPQGDLSMSHPYFWSSFTLIGNWN